MTALADEVLPGSAVRAPYVGLASFDSEQSLIFFGRDRDTRLIASNLLAYKITVLYGPSGVGKSSVLQAGVVPEVRSRIGSGGRAAPPVVAYVNSWRDDPTDVIDLAVRRQARRAGIRIDAVASSDRSLVERLVSWAQDVDSELFMVFDQFEDHFLYHEVSSAATAALGEALSADVPHLHVLLSVREDALAQLDRFQDFVPQILDNTYRLNHLDRRGADAAIRGPIGVYNRRTSIQPPWDFEDGIVDRVLDEVRVGGLVVSASGLGHVGAAATDAYETTHIQLVMERLWHAEQMQSDHTIEIRTLEALGGAEGIVRSHLRESLSGLTSRERDVAAEAFLHLVTPSGTKIAFGTHDLAEYCDAREPEVAAVLDKLASADRRVLRPVPPAPERPAVERYEIFHDALGGPISEWRHAHVARRNSRRERRRRIALACVAAVLAGLMILAFAMYLRARQQTSNAKSQRLASESLAELPTDPVEAGRRALDAWSTAHTQEAENAVRQALGSIHVDDSLTGHSGAVTSVDSARDGRLLTASKDGTARLWPANGGNPIVLEDGQYPITKGLFSPDGRTVATLSQGDDSIRTWDAETGERLVLFRADGIGFIDFAFTPDGKSLAALLYGGEVRLRELARDDERTIMETGASAIAFTSGGALVIGTRDGDLEVVDPVSGTTLAAVDGTSLDPVVGSVRKIATDAARGLIAFGDRGGRVWVWRGQQAGPAPQLIRTGAPPGNSVADLVFSADGTYLAAAIEKLAVVVAIGEPDDSGQVAVSDAALVEGANDWVNAIAFGPDSWVVSVSRDGTGRVNDAATGALLTELRRHDGSIDDVAVGPDGAIVTASRDRTARVWRLRPDRVFDGASGWLIDLAVDDAHQRIVAAGQEGIVREWSLDSGDVEKEYDVDIDGDQLGFLNTVAIDPSGRFVAAAGSSRRVTIWSRDHPADPVASYDLEASIRDLAFTGDGQLLIGSEDGSVVAWTWDDDRAPVTQVAKHPGRARVAVSSAGRIATGDSSGAIAVWDATSHQQLWSEVAHNDEVLALAFSPDGQQLVSAGGDRTARVWDVATGDLVRELAGHRSRLTGAAFNADGTEVTTAADDGTLAVWDLSTGTYRFLAQVHGDSADAVAFLEDDRLVSVGDDNVVRIVSCDSCGSVDKVVDALEDRLSRIPRIDNVQASPQVVANTDIAEGMCLPRSEGPHTHVEPVDCGDPHAAEVYAVIWLRDAPDAKYPGEEIYRRTDKLCRDGHFERYVGIAAESSLLDTTTDAPIKESWNAGNRQVACLIIDRDGATGSARGSGE